ncbi:MAG: hypothetical protein HY078_11205 [Elusimicrobia bacterium]|nr:hypothetical protein [Elusimicrobiota bacterium]
MRMIQALLAAAVLAASAGAQGGPVEPYLHGLSPAEKAQFVSTLQKSVLEAAREVLQDVKHPKVRNGAYALDFLRERVQRRIEAKEFALTHQRVQSASGALERKVSEETAKFLEELGPEVDRMARDSRSARDLSTRLIAVSDHFEQWAGAAPAKAAAAPAGTLTPTADNVLGPFHRPNARLYEPTGPMPDIAARESGRRLHIQGRVLDVSGKPIPGAIVDVWQTDKDGAYDIPDPRERDNPAFPYRFRGRIRTSDDGSHSYVTIKPGNYEFAEKQWRSMHVHYKVTAPGFKDLVTQLFFEGDAYSPADPWWKASTTIKLRTHHSGMEMGNFDIVLEKK